jgi:DNA-binding protein YbaB
MQEAQKMQRVITEKQEEIFKTNYEGKSGFVTVVLSGKKEMVSILPKIDMSLDT